MATTNLVERLLTQGGKNTQNGDAYFETPSGKKIVGAKINVHSSISKDEGSQASKTANEVVWSPDGENAIKRGVTYFDPQARRRSEPVYPYSILNLQFDDQSRSLKDLRWRDPRNGVTEYFHERLETVIAQELQKLKSRIQPDEMRILAGGFTVKIDRLDSLIHEVDNKKKLEYGNAIVEEFRVLLVETIENIVNPDRKAPTPFIGANINKGLNFTEVDFATTKLPAVPKPEDKDDTPPPDDGGGPPPDPDKPKPAPDEKSKDDSGGPPADKSPPTDKMDDDGAKADDSSDAPGMIKRPPELRRPGPDSPYYAEKSEDWHAGGSRVLVDMHVPKDPRSGLKPKGQIILEHWPSYSESNKSVVLDEKNCAMRMVFDVTNNDLSYNEIMALVETIQGNMRVGRDHMPVKELPGFTRGNTGTKVGRALALLDCNPQYSRYGPDQDQLYNMMQDEARRNNETLKQRRINSGSFIERIQVVRRELVTVDDGQNADGFNYDPWREEWDPRDLRDPANEEKLLSESQLKTHKYRDFDEILNDAQLIEAKEGREKALEARQTALSNYIQRNLYGQYQYRIKMFERDTRDKHAKYRLVDKQWQQIRYFHDDDGHHMYALGAQHPDVPYIQGPEDAMDTHLRTKKMSEILNGLPDRDMRHSMVFSFLGDLQNNPERIWRELGFYMRTLALEEENVKTHDDMMSKSMLVKRMIAAVNKERRVEDEHPDTEDMLVGFFRCGFKKCLHPKLAALHFRNCLIEDSELVIVGNNLSFTDTVVQGKSKIIFAGPKHKEGAQSVIINRGYWHKSVELYGRISSGHLAATRFACNMLGMTEFNPTFAYKTWLETYWAMRGCKIEIENVQNDKLYSMMIPIQGIPLFGSVWYQYQRAKMGSQRDLANLFVGHDGDEIYVDSLELDYKGGTDRVGTLRHGALRIGLAGKDNQNRTEWIFYRATPDDIKKNHTWGYLLRMYARSVPLVRTALDRTVSWKYMVGDDKAGFIHFHNRQGVTLDWYESAYNELPYEILAANVHRIGSKHKVVPPHNPESDDDPMMKVIRHVSPEDLKKVPERSYQYLGKDKKEKKAA